VDREARSNGGGVVKVLWERLAEEKHAAVGGPELALGPDERKSLTLRA
jgi:hypothetical protein